MNGLGRTLVRIRYGRVKQRMGSNTCGATPWTPIHCAKPWVQDIPINEWKILQEQDEEVSPKVVTGTIKPSSSWSPLEMGSLRRSSPTVTGRLPWVFGSSPKSWLGEEGKSAFHCRQSMEELNRNISIAIVSGRYGNKSSGWKFNHGENQ
eukprot:scaffold15451_cov169-Amphora_coffeaeformis.AAC.1